MQRGGEARLLRWSRPAWPRCTDVRALAMLNSHIPMCGVLALQDLPALAFSLDNYGARSEEQYATAARYCVALIKVSNGRGFGGLIAGGDAQRGLVRWAASAMGAMGMGTCRGLLLV